MKKTFFRVRWELLNNHQSEEGRMECSTPTFDVNIDPAGWVLDLDSLYAALARLRDKRRARGVRYALVTVLTYVVLAKLSGQDSLAGIAHWVRLRMKMLAQMFPLKKLRTPCANTYRNILGQVIDVAEFELVVRDFFARQPHAGQSIVISLDGKTLRGTITAEHSQGQHLLAAFVPAEGWVLFQVEVDGQENEISAAPRVLKQLDLRGKIVTGDAIFAQRELSLQIIEAGGDYVWTVKDNQATLRQDIELLFQPEKTVKGFSAGVKDFRTAQTVEKNRGRLERRTLTVSAELKEHLDWPGAEQVFQVERYFERIRDHQVTHEVTYGITSLSPAKVTADELLHHVRQHWGIENGLHYRRDVTLCEDACRLKRGQAPRALAVVNNLVIGLTSHLGWTNLAAARRYFDAHLDQAQKVILRRLADF
jgi:predicted transposase YbfD/YdcC